MKKLMFPLMLILAAAGWFTTINGLGKENQALAQHMVQAKEYERKGIYIDALTEYQEALKYTKDPYPIHLKVMEMYAELAKYSSYVSYGEELLKEYNYPEEVVINLVNYYKESKKTQYAVEVLKRASEEKKDNELFYRELVELKGAYSSRYLSKDDVSSLYNGYMVYEKNGQWGLMDKDGADKIKPIYQSITPYASEPKLATVKQENEWFCIDINGYKKLVPDHAVEELGMFGQGLIAFKSDGKYGYMDSNLQIVKAPEWEYAGVFANGTAPVKKDGKWSLIDREFQPITTYIYDEIVISEFGIATEYEVYFAMQNGRYYLFRSDGERMEQSGFEQAVPFAAASEPAAICQNGKWGFVDQQGGIVIEPQYEEAKSFSCELAPVRFEDKWGYIDMSNRIRILPEFDQACPFSKNGTAPVLNRSWMLITLIQ